MSRARIPAIVAQDGGGVAIYIGLAAGILFGAGALAVDLGRYMALNTELQSAADAIALAAAAELNGEPAGAAGDDAITRATRAAAGAFGQNRQTYATDDAGAEVTAYTLTFLQSLPTDGTDITAANVTTDPTLARFVHVDVSPRQLEGGLISVLAGPRTLSTRATAVAGFTQVTCQVMPLMICNPTENPGGGGDFTLNVGQQILVKTVGAGASWAPGNFGLMDPPRGGQGAANVAHYLASANPAGCYTGNGYNSRPGTANAIRTALNTRFDMYDNPGFGSEKNNPEYRPARNVTKGKFVAAGGGGGKGGGGSSACSPTAGTAPDAMALPRDSCFVAGTCDRFGNGVWDIAGYWLVNHGGTYPGPVMNWAYNQGLTSAPTAYPNPTRYDVYRWEIDQAQIPDSNVTTGTGKENGAPACYTGSTPPDDDPDRRLLNLAVVNCIEEGVNGNGPVHPIAFLKGFITEPVGGASEAEIYVEVVDVIRTRQLDGVMHDIVQLYR